MTSNKQTFRQIRKVLNSLEWIEFIDDIQDFLENKPKISKKDAKLLKQFGFVF